ncbi:MAG: hypothetical protein AABZ55_02905 [Bdellovibrionota bacterium]
MGNRPTILKHEKEHEGPIYKHPYFLYVILTMVIFGFLIIVGWVALDQGWIPSRGISSSS